VIFVGVSSNSGSSLLSSSSSFLEKSGSDEEEGCSTARGILLFLLLAQEVFVLLSCEEVELSSSLSFLHFLVVFLFLAFDLFLAILSTSFAVGILIYE